MEVPKPQDEHRKLQMLVGSWTGEEKMHPSPWDPQGGTAIARIKNRSALDGFIVVQDYEQERDGQITFRGHGVFSFNAENNEYRLHWWDSMGMPPNIFRGTLLGNKLTLTNKEQMGLFRAIFVLEKDSYKHSLETSQDGENWQPLMEATYKRD